MSDRITVTGGYTRAETDTFRAAADALARAHDAADAACSRARAAWAVLSGTGVNPLDLLDPARALRERARADVGAALGPLADAAAAWASLRTAVLRAGHLYEEGEDLVGAIMRTGTLPGLGLALGEAGVGVVRGALRDGHPDLMDAFRGLGSHTEDATAGLGRALTWIAPYLPDRVAVGAGMVGTLDGVLAAAGAVVGRGPGARTDLVVDDAASAPDGTPLADLPAPRTVEQALRQVHDVSGAAGPGTVAVQRLGAGPDARWLVTIPGTQTYDPTTTNPLDGRTDLDLVAGNLSDAEVETAEAMRRADVPAGATVVLVGHSLGGIAAARLAADDHFRARYEVGAVVTAGSPIGGIRVPSSTTVVSVENSSEGVSGLDGRANPASEQQVTVHADLDDATLDAAAAEGRNAHDVRLHADVLERARASGDPALDRALDRVDALLAGDGDGSGVGAGNSADPATAPTWYVTGRRE